MLFQNQRQGSGLTKLVVFLIALLSSVVVQAGNDHAATLQQFDYQAAPIFGFDNIHVYSSDGQSWDTFAGAPVKFAALLNAKVNSQHYIVEWKLFLGYCADNGACLNPQHPILAQEVVAADKVNKWRQITLDMNSVPQQTNPGSFADTVLDLCNEELQPVSGANQNHSFNIGFQTTMGLDTHEPGYISKPDVDFVAHDLIPVRVNCHAYQIDSSELDVPDQTVEPEQVELFLSTFANEYTYPEDKKQCKKGRVLVRVTTDQPGPVDVRLWTLGVDGPDSEFVQAWSSHVGSGEYQAEYVKWVTVSDDAELQAMAEVLNNGQGFGGLQSEWKYLPLECRVDTPDLTTRPDERPTREDVLTASGVDANRGFGSKSR